MPISLFDYDKPINIISKSLFVMNNNDGSTSPRNKNLCISRNEAVRKLQNKHIIAYFHFKII